MSDIDIIENQINHLRLLLTQRKLTLDEIKELDILLRLKKDQPVDEFYEENDDHNSNVIDLLSELRADGKSTNS